MPIGGRPGGGRAGAALPPGLVGFSLPLLPLRGRALPGLAASAPSPSPSGARRRSRDRTRGSPAPPLFLCHTAGMVGLWSCARWCAPEVATSAPVALIWTKTGAAARDRQNRQPPEHRRALSSERSSDGLGALLGNHPTVETAQQSDSKSYSQNRGSVVVVVVVGGRPLSPVVGTSSARPPAEVVRRTSPSVVRRPSLSSVQPPNSGHRSRLCRAARRTTHMSETAPVALAPRRPRAAFGVVVHLPGSAKLRLELSSIQSSPPPVPGAFPFRRPLASSTPKGLGFLPRRRVVRSRLWFRYRSFRSCTPIGGWGLAIG